ncbi:glycosyltransferase [Microbispora corallina]|uniref:UDP-glucosyltransferase YjiC n=1 Tax=Microbispora corallina TaxID=83302 RepID=A0ABQ4G6V4_9ACTN|nr:glycosyltransferase [Microbispora corallina]GIH42812.1 putative UDP-glucosyltransferase YjiC [Microbispora corallina]
MTALRVIFFAFSRSSLGHIVRSTTAAARFAREGHTVTVACHEECRGIPERAGVAWYPVRELGPAPAWRGMDDPERLREFSRGRLASPAYIAECLEDELRLIDGRRPDVVISDMRNTAGVAAAMRGVPSYSIHNLRLFRHPMHVVLPEIIATLSSLGVPDRHARRVLGDAVLVPDLAVLDDLAGVPPETAALICSLTREIRHVGPLLPPGTPETAKTPRAPVPATQDGFLHVTLGGSGAGNHEIRRVVDAVGDLDLRVQITLGVAATPEVVRSTQRELAALARRATVRVTGFRPDAVDVTRAADAVVTHGGHGSITEGLAAGTPLVFLPHSPEQRLNAARVEELGLGVVLAPGDDAVVVRDKILAAVKLKGGAQTARFREALVSADGAGQMVSYVTGSLAVERAVSG